MNTLVLNKAARDHDRFSMFGKIRTKMVDGVLFLKPTDRKGPVNLPKTDRLVEVSNGRFEVEGADLTPGTYGLVADKYHWFGLQPIEGKAPRGPSVRVA